MKLNSPVYDSLFNTREHEGAAFFLLLDPDKVSLAELPGLSAAAEEAGVDGFLVGGSLSLLPQMEQTLQSIKIATTKPVIIFPGGVHHLSPIADAVLFLSMISGRNPDHLIGQHVVAAPLIRQMELEAISTGYMIVESGEVTTTEFMSHSKPLPRNKPEIAAAHAIAAELLGMNMLYLEAGSGAKLAVPTEMVSMVSSMVDIPVVVGGGIRSPEQVSERVKAGAKAIVIGNYFEEEGHFEHLRSFVEAAHTPEAGYSTEL
jgi:phosphoglycerol geranylgeranyltransferase